MQPQSRDDRYGGYDVSFKAAVFHEADASNLATTSAAAETVSS